MTETATLTLAAQLYGPDPDESTSLAHHELRQLLREKCKGPYSSEVGEFALILRIDGKFHQWNREGCAYLRRSFKEKYITIDIFVPTWRWKNKSEREIREYFAEGAREALTLCIKRLQKDKTPVDGERLLSDYETVVEEYLDVKS